MYTFEQDASKLAFQGLSTDEKPTFVEYVKGQKIKVPNGSSFYEMDLHKVYMFDEENSRWILQ